MHRIGSRDVEIEVPRAPTDRWVSVIGLDLAGPPAPDSALYLPAKGAPVALHVFDGRVVGEGIRYGDGKRARDVTLGWTKAGSGVEWLVRTIAPARYHVSLEYATAGGTSSDAFTITIGTQQLSGRVSPTGGDTLFVTREIGDIDISAGEYLLTVRAAQDSGTELMRLRRVVLTPVSKQTMPRQE